MRVKRLPMAEIVTLARVVILEAEEDDDEEPFTEDESLKPGTYAMDGDGRIWKLEEVITGLFQELMDAEIKRKK